jgi:hypothetical protein
MAKTYEYKLRPMGTLLAMLFFGACAGFMFYLAVTNDRGLIINGLITLDPKGADVFYAVTGIVSALFVVLGLVSLIAAIFSKKEASIITLEDDYVLLPQRGRLEKIPYKEIQSIKITEVNSVKVADITAAQGKKFSITNIKLSDKFYFNDIVNVLQEKSGVKE